MKNMTKLFLLASALLGANAFASYQRMAVCTGVSQSSLNARVTLFVNKTTDTLGQVVVSFDNGLDYISDTAVDWTSNPNGFPHFSSNDFDLDIVISDSAASSDDMLVGEEFISQVTCSYAPN
jgi:hypothetical protein